MRQSHHATTIGQFSFSEGKSGLDINGREALQELIGDVTNGRADYSMKRTYINTTSRITSGEELK